MLNWDADAVRFMKDASEYTDYHRRLAGKVKPHLKPTDRICDAGCGTGYLSLELADSVAEITAVDRSGAPLELLRENCRLRGITNIRPVAGDIHAHAPKTPYDHMIFCFFGRIWEILPIARTQCRGSIFMMKKDDAVHRFSQEQHPIGWDSCDNTEGWLIHFHIPYELERLELELGQPFHSLEDAGRFYDIYSRDADKAAGREAFLRERVKRTEDPQFPYYLAGSRRMGLFRLNARDIPDNIEP